MAKGYGARALLLNCSAVIAFSLSGCAAEPEMANVSAGGGEALTASLADAARSGDLDRVTALVEAGASLNTFSDGETPLAQAVGGGEDRIVWYLLSQGATPDLAGEGHPTPLMVAAGEGQRRLVRLLLSAGADVNAVAADGATPVLLAARNGHLSVVKVLLAAGANVNVSQHGRSLLMHVVDGGDLLTAEMLVSAGADVNYRSPDGLTALDIARSHHNEDLEMLLIQSGAGF